MRIINKLKYNISAQGDCIQNMHVDSANKDVKQKLLSGFTNLLYVDRIRHGQLSYRIQG